MNAARYPSPAVVMAKLSQAVTEVVSQHQKAQGHTEPDDEVREHLHSTILFFVTKEIIERRGEARFRESVERAVTLAKE
jgi:hypothetical protein